MKNILKVSLFASIIWCSFHLANANCGPRVDEAIEAGRSCRKPCVTKADCRGEFKTCNCDDFCGLSCFNLGSECEKLQVDNGRISYTNSLLYKSEAKYSCNVGYYLVNGTKRVCRSDKKWSGFEPTCEQGCRRPPLPSNAYNLDFSTVAFRTGEEVRFKCHWGYEGSGRDTVTCLSNHNWTRGQFVCSKIHCGNPPYLANGVLVGGDYRFASTVTYHCNNGFKLRGASEIVCGTDKQWSPNKAPRCEGVTCPAPPIIVKHSLSLKSVRPSYRFRDAVKYECIPGYSSKPIFCTGNGTWSEGTPCQAIACVPIPPIANSIIHNSEWKFGDVFILRCTEGYEPTGIDVISCGVDGQWPSLPSCRPIACDALPSVPKMIFPWETVFYGSEIPLHCEAGFKLSGPKAVSCDVVGGWGDLPQCTEAVTCSFDLTYSASSHFCKKTMWLKKYCFTAESAASRANLGWIPDHERDYLQIDFARDYFLAYLGTKSGKVPRRFFSGSEAAYVTSLDLYYRTQSGFYTKYGELSSSSNDMISKKFGTSEVMTSSIRLYPMSYHKYALIKIKMLTVYC